MFKMTYKIRSVNRKKQTVTMSPTSGSILAITFKTVFVNLVLAGAAYGALSLAEKRSTKTPVENDPSTETE